MTTGRVAVLLLLVGCHHTTEVVWSEPDEGGVSEMDARVDAASDAGLEADAEPDAAEDAGAGAEGGTAWCKGSLCQCDNGLDDDMDGLTDGFDPECTGPFDKDEGSFATGYNSGNPKCDDCFFDENPSSNDDKCDVAAQCSVDGTSNGAPGSCNTCQPLGECINNCKPRTPNGCDCFGCCEFPFQGGTIRVKLVDTCTMAELGNPQRCPLCQLTESECFNPCDRCELCAGKTTLPPDCGATNVCSNGNPCKQTSECAAREYCTQGCCVEYVY